MRVTAGIALLNLAVAWCAEGCGGDSRTQDPGVAPVAGAREFLARFSQVACGGLASCCVDGGRPADESACLDDPGPILPFGFADFRDTPHVRFDAAEGERCLDAFQTAMTKCHDPAAKVDAEYHCRLVFRGDVADDGSCRWFGDCAYPRHEISTCVSFDDIQAHGTCKGAGPLMPWTGVEGEPCFTTCVRDNAGNANCPPASADAPILAGCYVEDGLFCSGTCQRLPGAGEPCEGNRCAPDAYCESGTCKLRGAGTCAKSTECASSMCVAGACAPRAPLGSPCEDSIECDSDACVSGICVTGSYPTDEVCAIYPSN